MTKIDLTPQHLGDYESRLEGGRWHIVRLPDEARFVYTSPNRWEGITRDWGYQVGAESWIRVLRNPFYAEQIARNGAWEPPAARPGAEGAFAVQPGGAEPDDDCGGMAGELEADIDPADA